MKKNIDDVIGMAWSDKISFEEIKKKTGLKEKEVISFMRKNLKKKSYVIWRKRVRGRLSKHRKRSKVKLSNYEF
ncbi:MAG: TIGR03643 family protein [Candidatus Pelagibacter sp.]|mgnify:FL=1